MKRISLLLLLLLSSCNGYVDKPYMNNLKAKIVNQDMTNIRNEIYDYYAIDLSGMTTKTEIGYWEV